MESCLYLVSVVCKCVVLVVVVVGGVVFGLVSVVVGRGLCWLVVYCWHNVFQYLCRWVVNWRCSLERRPGRSFGGKLGISLSMEVKL